MLVDALLESNRRVPNNLAVADSTRELTYRNLTRLASILRATALNATSCERIGLMLPSVPAFPAALMGVLWAGKIAIPLNFLLSAEELSRITQDAGLDLIVTVAHFRDLAARLPARTIFLEDLHLKRSMVLTRFRRFPSVPRADSNATAVILYTSGTTAEPKGVELSYGNLHSNCVDTIFSLGIDDSQTFLNVLPPFHVFGLTGTVLVPIMLGTSVYCIPRFSPVAVAQAVDERAITVLMAIPSMYAALLKTKSTRANAFRSVFLAVSGGEPLPESVRRGFEDRFGVTLKQGYGLTETSPVVSACSATEHRAGTVGRPIRNVEVAIVDSAGNTQSRNADGEIVVGGPGVMKGYYNKPEETRQVLDSSGRFHTGDIGHIDDDGFLSITGRAKEMLIIGGENVFPREIEAVLESHAEVLQAAVIGMNDDLRGEVPAAFVIPTQSATISEQSLRNFAKESLAGFKVPRRIEIREDLPKGPTGKILKRKLRELL